MIISMLSGIIGMILAALKAAFVGLFALAMTLFSAVHPPAPKSAVEIPQHTSADLSAASRNVASTSPSAFHPTPEHTTATATSSGATRVTQETLLNTAIQITHSLRPTTNSPGPLPVIYAGQSNVSSNLLLADEIIGYSNIERKKQGLSPLALNLRLAAIAEAKAVDMIQKKYFAHVSPSGVDIGNMAERFGYQYLHVGENLALGDFASSSHVVNGWMNSPGHRANILGKDYTEIGVAALRGTWEGREVWFAVQEFGKPLPDCPKPDDILKQKIVLYETQLTTLDATLTQWKADVEQPGIDPGVYNKKIDDYNRIADMYNKLLQEEKVFVADFNRQVSTYNSCIGE